MKIVSLKTAKLAESLGYPQYDNNPQSYCYFNEVLLNNSPRYFTIYSTDLNNTVNGKQSSNHTYYLEQYQNDVVDWIRDKNNIHIEIKYWFARKKYMYSILTDDVDRLHELLIDPSFNVESECYFKYSYYYECLEKALYQVLTYLIFRTI